MSVTLLVSSHSLVAQTGDKASAEPTVTITKSDGTYHIPVRYLENRSETLDDPNINRDNILVAFQMPSAKPLEKDWAKWQLTFSNDDPRSRGLFSSDAYVVSFEMLEDVENRPPFDFSTTDPLVHLGNVIFPSDKMDFSREYGLLKVKKPMSQTWYFANIYDATMRASLKANLECFDAVLVHPPPPPANCRGFVQDEAIGLRYKIDLPRAKVSEFLAACREIRSLVRHWFTPTRKK